jgi:glutamine amidotransferase PdxT
VVSELTTLRIVKKRDVLKAVQDLIVLTEESWTMTRLVNESIAYMLKEKHGIDLEDY